MPRLNRYIGSSGGWPAGDLFTPLTFLMYNLGDFLGRSLAGYRRKPVGTGFLAIYAVFRASLIPALAFCNVITPHPWVFAAYFRSPHSSPALVQFDPELSNSISEDHRLPFASTGVSVSESVFL